MGNRGPAHRWRAGAASSLPLVQWLFTGLLILVSAGLAAYTGYLVRRLFTTSPGVADVPSEPAR
jgi:hypothetical protein